MKKAIIAAAALCWTMAPLQAQKKYEKIMYQSATAQSDDMDVTAKNGVSTKDMTKFKLQIANKTNDILLYKPAESQLTLKDKQIKPVERSLEIDPMGTDWKVINFSGSEFMIPSYSYVVDGVYRIATDGKAIEAPDFSLPPSQNEFQVGNFTCNMTDLNKESAKTTVKFDCKYTGDKVGVIHINRAGVKLPDGTEVANANSKKAPIMLLKGESKKFTLAWNRMEGGRANDMQKIKLLVLWRNTFIESDLIKVKPVTVELKIDEAESK